ncbi:hypothetical protein Pelo_3770 [Pelomyxa schiedti]|nr:hypothetical protein Pelo_3770 [Pelomyxa schiedti]
MNSLKGYAGLRTEECIDMPTIEVIDGPVTLPARPQYSLVSRELWERCATTFQGMLPTGSQTVSLSEVRRQWKDDSPFRSTYEVSAAERRIEIAGNEVSLSQFALGSLLLSRTSNYPKFCSVQQYIESGFSGASMLASCCDGHQFYYILFLVLLIVNAIASVASMAIFWISPIAVVTLGIAIFLFYMWHSVFFVWKNEHLPGSALGFASYSLLCLAVGFFIGVLQWGEPRVTDWYKFWYAWCTLQLVYFCLSTVLLAHICLLLKNISLSTQIPVPQVTLATSHMVMAWGFLGVCIVCFAIVSVVSACLSDFHVVAVGGAIGFSLIFVGPSLGLFIAAWAQGYPRRLSISGLVACGLTLIVAGGLCAAFTLTGSFIPLSEEY